ncbi:sulfatase-like hydrolase/transferase [Candidatus Poribacteria bacterium]|nr:sulfatase-like hydrolase/transferase [Candidatus Poribacteria bacterium]MYB00960.1 sulfatase-like hydrolase/transferase [Candidatus Poribacteria bacterium]
MTTYMTDNPNVILIFADDLGRGMLSCYGQQHFETPNIDRLASQGMKFNHAYGCAFCAPSRASMLTGIHDCHQGTWTYTQGGLYHRLSAGELTLDQITELLHTTGLQAGPDDVFLAQIAEEAGYVTGQIGKLEWGFATTGARIRRHGWQYHYGYYDHQRCHGFYPPYLFENGQTTPIRGNTHADCAVNPNTESPENMEFRRNRQGKAVYSQDIFNEKIIEFLRTHHDKPFFLYHPSQLPHGPIAVPDIHPAVKQVSALTTYEKEYASMILKLDETVSIILDELEQLGIDDRTMIVFSADNGHEVYYRQQGRTTGRQVDLEGNQFDDITTKFYSETGGDVFNGNDGMGGLKWSSWEGGTRIPYIVRWPGRVTPNSVSDHMLTNYDLMPTLADFIGAEMPQDKDGVSFLPTLLERCEDQQHHEWIIYASRLGPALVTAEGWKLRYINRTDSFQLYHLPNDYREENDLSADHPDFVTRLSGWMRNACDGDYRNGTPQAHFVAYPDEN